MDAGLIDTDVVIVGAGPAGLATANYLGLAGVRAVIIERNSGTVDEPRAVSIDDESLRSMQTLGLVDQVVARTLPGYGSRYYSPGGREFACKTDHYGIRLSASVGVSSAGTGSSHVAGARSLPHHRSLVRS